MKEKLTEITEVLMWYDVPEDNFHYQKPFVYYRGDDLYLEYHWKVKPEHKEMVLRAVKEYKTPNKSSTEYYHQDLDDKHNKNVDNAYDYWFISFRYQAIGGGLVLWWDIDKNWASELARRGEHVCPKCGTKTVMYYRPFCPNCGEITKTKGAVNLYELAYHLSHRSGVEYHDYIDAFMNETYDDFGNDRACSISLPENSDKCLVEMNEMFDFNEHLFWISW